MGPLSPDAAAVRRAEIAATIDARHSRLRRCRRGEAAELQAVLPRVVQVEQAFLQQQADAAFGQLVAVERQVTAIIDDLSAEVEAVDSLRAVRFQLENNKTALSDLSRIQAGLKSQQTTAQEELQWRAIRSEQLQSELDALSRCLNNAPQKLPYDERELIQWGQKLSQNISNSIRNS